MGRSTRDREIERRIADRIFEARRLRKMSASKLAERVGVHRNTLSRIESGDGTVTVSGLIRIADALEIDISLFFTTAPFKMQKP